MLVPATARELAKHRKAMERLRAELLRHEDLAAWLISDSEVIQPPVVESLVETATSKTLREVRLGGLRYTLRGRDGAAAAQVEVRHMHHDQFSVSVQDIAQGRPYTRFAKVVPFAELADEVAALARVMRGPE